MGDSLELGVLNASFPKSMHKQVGNTKRKREQAVCSCSFVWVRVGNLAVCSEGFRSG